MAAMKAASSPLPQDARGLWARLVDRAPARLRAYLLLARVDRPVGTMLLLWPTWWGLWLAAEGLPPARILIIFTLGVILMRAAGCAINDYADRWLDPRVARTRNRPLAAGLLSPRAALVFFAACALLAFGLVLLTNRLTVLLSVPAVLLAAVYPYLKRITHLAQVGLGAAFAWAVPMAFAAVLGHVPQLAWLCFIAVLFWVVAYDTLYAMADRKEDLKAGAKSTAILFGELDLVAVGICHAAFLLGMVLVGRQAGLGWPYVSALLIAAALAGWQLWYARPRTPARCLSAFRSNQWLGAVLWTGIAAAYLLRHT